MKLQPIGRFLLFCILLVLSHHGMSQVGINTSTPRGILDVNSPNTGIVLPRVALTATNNMSPVTNPQTGTIPEGTVVYNTATTSTGTNDVTPGLYTWNGTRWISQFQRRQYAFYESAAGSLRTNPGTTYTISLNGSSTPSFTANYTGTYKIRVRVDFGGGDAERPNEGSGSNRSDGDLNIANATGTFTFTFNGTNYYIPVNSYSTAYRNVTPATNYFAIWQEFFITEEVNLTANQTVTLRLRFRQDTAEEFSSAYGGRGYVAYDIPCSVEIAYVGE
jgi:hypothetical protein